MVATNESLSTLTSRQIDAEARMQRAGYFTLARMARGLWSHAPVISCVLVVEQNEIAADTCETWPQRETQVESCFFAENAVMPCLSAFGRGLYRRAIREERERRSFDV